MKKTNNPLNRREFIATGALFVAGSMAAKAYSTFDISPTNFSASAAPKGLMPQHFPSAVHAFVWRNWTLVPLSRLAKTIQAKETDLVNLAKLMGLPAKYEVSKSQWERSYLTVIRRNWHLLPRTQLLTLLDWTDEELSFTLIEDDFFYVKLGNLKPECPEIHWQDLAKINPKELSSFNKRLKTIFPKGWPKQEEPYFYFVEDLSKPVLRKEEEKKSDSGFSPRIAYPYFALFGDPLLSESTESYPDAYLERMHLAGVDSIWMHIVLSKLTPFPWEPQQSKNWEQRLVNLSKLVTRAKNKGISIFLYLNEPRHQSEAFFAKYPNLRGVGNGLCTSVSEVQDYLKTSIATIAERVPNLGGFFSITASENPTNCWSHYRGKECQHCGPLGAAKVISTLNNVYLQGISEGFKAIQQAALSNVDPFQMPKLIVWDWGWQNGLAEELIPALDRGNVSFMSVSEWDLPINRGGVESRVGEYSISSIGPGPRAQRHWKIAKDLGIPCIAKIQTNNSWEIGAVPYIPALFNVGQHIENLRQVGVSGLMLGWSLGGYPSVNMEMVAMMGENKNLKKEDAMLAVAQSRFGNMAAKAVVQSWKKYSLAFSEFPYFGGVVYSAPLHAGPSNLLWPKPTNYTASMVGIPYDDLKSWRGVYPEDVFIQQMEKVYKGFEQTLTELKGETNPLKLTKENRKQLDLEMQVAEAIVLHYQSVANQSRYVQLRDRIGEKSEMNAEEKNTMKDLLQTEFNTAQKLAKIQSKDSRIGFEASNHYFYVPQDLYEKMLNCQYLLDTI